ncbi:type I-E CRISPR-associated protein Cse2/CasB [Kitasatospora sp. NPDC088134]|uniref:type I-E CRISPR-associated protein Cse2/CasB n=1 Tax=Kitasatospora sp. NPDC088134 TaxID=3364071 RepID=UPI0038042CE0
MTEDGFLPPEEFPHDSEALVRWLTTLVRNREYGTLAALRRTGAPTDAHIRAGWYGGDRQRRVFEQVAGLFALYHQGRAVPAYGFGSVGAAAARIGDGTGRGPRNPGAQRLMERVVASRRVPWRHLQHTVVRLRAGGQPPPSWAQLTEDLVRWNDRTARVAYRWSVDFHAPPGRGRDRRPPEPTAKDGAA